jgi:hypothetical protein
MNIITWRYSNNTRLHNVQLYDMLIVNKDPAAEEIVVEIPKGIINPSLPLADNILSILQICIVRQMARAASQPFQPNHCAH